MENVAEIMDDSITSVLPPEVLSNIISFLKLEDRKKARLVSRFWYDCSIRSKIAEREKFVFRDRHCVKDIAKVLPQSYYPQLNLEFQGLLINSIPTKMWKMCGERIVTLKFFDCDWNESTLSNIIYYCKNLTSFVIETALVDDLKHQFPSSLPAVFTDLLEKGIRRPKLRTFSVLIDSMYSTPVCAIREIFLLFPSLEQFCIGEVSYTETFLYTNLLFYGIQALDSLPMDKQDLIAFTRLESFTFNLLTRGEWMETFIEEDKQGHRLKRFETMLHYESYMKDILYKFFKMQENLQFIRLGIGNVLSVEIKDFLFHVLECCPKLRELHLKCELEHVCFEPSELPRFFASIKKLKALSLSFDVVGSEESAPSYHNLLSNTIPLELTSLKWDPCSVRNFEFVATFLERCSSLRHLDLAVCCDTSLQIIFKNMVELRTLVLDDITTCTSFGFTGCDSSGKESGYSIKRLQKLKHLEMRDHKFGFPAKITSELQLPQLEFLSIHVSLYEELSQEALQLLAYQLPEIKVLAIQSVNTKERMKKTIQLCKQLKNVYRLTFLNFSSFTPDRVFKKRIIDSMSNIFQVCPYLTYIADTRHNNMFWRDPFTGKIHSKAADCLKFSGNYVEGSKIVQPYKVFYRDPSPELIAFFDAMF